MWLLLVCECLHGSKCVCFSSFNNTNLSIGPFTQSGTCSLPIRCPPRCCQCRRAAWIGRCLQIYTDSVYWLRKELHLNPCLCMDTGFFFFKLKQVHLKVRYTTQTLRRSEFQRHVQCLMLIVKNGTAFGKSWKHTKQIEKLMPSRGLV